MNVMNCEKVCANRFFCRKVMNQGSCDAQAAIRSRPTALAWTILDDRAEVVGIGGVAEVERAFWRDCVSKTLKPLELAIACSDVIKYESTHSCPRRPHTIEHVRA